MMTVHVTEAELARDLHAVLEKVRQGIEVVIEHDSRPVAVLRAVAPRRRRLSEIAASLSAYSAATIDPDFAADVQAFINHREPLNPPEWD